LGGGRKKNTIPTTIARSAGFEPRPDGPPMDVVLCVCCVCVVLCVCVVFVLCLCCEKGVERVGVGGRGKYPGAPPHHLKKELADRKDQVVKGEGCSEKKKVIVNPKLFWNT
jgi:hypothetical protein